MKAEALDHEYYSRTQTVGKITYCALCRSAHGNDIICNVCEIKVITILFEPSFPLGHPSPDGCQHGESCEEFQDRQDLMKAN
jgi:hypothetical protein